MVQLGSHWKDFNEIGYLRGFFFFEKYAGKIQVSIRSDNNNRYFNP